MDIIIFVPNDTTNFSNVLPNFLININYNIIDYWLEYSNNIFIIINSKYNNFMNYYLKYKNNDNINIINNDTENSFLYVINYLFTNKIIIIKNKNLLITESNIFPNEKIKLKKTKNKKKSTISIFLHEEHILNMFYIEDYILFNIEDISNNDNKIKYNKYFLKNINNLINTNIKIINDDKLFKNNIDNNFNEINWYKYINKSTEIYIDKYEIIKFIPK